MPHPVANSDTPAVCGHVVNSSTSSMDTCWRTALRNVLGLKRLLRSTGRSNKSPRAMAASHRDKDAFLRAIAVSHAWGVSGPSHRRDLSQTKYEDSRMHSGTNCQRLHAGSDICSILTVYIRQRQAVTKTGPVRSKNVPKLQLRHSSYK